MSKDRDYPVDMLTGEDDSGWMSRILADEDALDRKAMWRLGSWGFGTVGVVVAALVIAKSPLALRRDQLAALEAQSQQVQWIAKESQNNARQLNAAVETLNSDRDRLYARVTMLEQNLDSVTGSISKQIAAPSPSAIPPSTPQATGPAPAEIAAISPAKPDMQAKTEQTKSEPAKSDTAAKTDPLPKIEAKEPPPKIAPVASVPATSPGEKKTAETDRKEPVVTGTLTSNSAQASDSAQEKPVQRTAFGVDLGNAQSIEGLRGVWRSVTKASGTSLQGLQPIVAIKEGTDGLGMRLHLIAGPLNDAAAAAKICATLIESKRPCETSVYDGQRMVLNDTNATTKSVRRRRSVQSVEEAPKRSGFSSIFSR